MDEPIPEEAQAPLDEFSRALTDFEAVLQEFVSVPLVEQAEVGHLMDVCICASTNKQDALIALPSGEGPKGVDLAFHAQLPLLVTSSLQRQGPEGGREACHRVGEWK
jgi:hypothetical protein